MSDSTLSALIASTGDHVAVQDWPLDDDVPMRGVVLIVHGLGEHGGRYNHVARKLNSWGFAVRAHDHYGHGESAGVRGGLPDKKRLISDLADVVATTRGRMPRSTPLILLGHSLGGLVAAQFVALRMRPIDALVLSSPAFDPGLSAFQKLLLAVLPRIAPNLRVGNGVKPQYISHDPAVVSAYKKDHWVHDRISARLASYIADTGPKTVAMAKHWKVPTLLMYAGDDRLVNPEGSRAFAAAAPTQHVQSVCFDKLYHEIFNEQDSASVFDTLKAWLDARY